MSRPYLDFVSSTDRDGRTTSRVLVYPDPTVEGGRHRSGIHVKALLNRLRAAAHTPSIDYGFEDFTGEGTDESAPKAVIA